MSYFPYDGNPGAPGRAWRCSRYRSRSSRALDTSAASSFAFGFFSRLGCSFAGSGVGPTEPKRSRHDAVVSIVDGTTTDLFRGVFSRAGNTFGSPAFATATACTSFQCTPGGIGKTSRPAPIAPPLVWHGY